MEAVSDWILFVGLGDSLAKRTFLPLIRPARRRGCFNGGTGDWMDLRGSGRTGRSAGSDRAGRRGG